MKKKVLYATLTPLLGVDMRSKKINGHHIVRQNLMKNPKKITVLCLENFYFGPNAALKKTTLNFKCFPFFSNLTEFRLLEFFHQLSLRICLHLKKERACVSSAAFLNLLGDCEREYTKFDFLN
jgi:hypothetical protein